MTVLTFTEEIKILNMIRARNISSPGTNTCIYSYLVTCNYANRNVSISIALFASTLLKRGVRWGGVGGYCRLSFSEFQIVEVHLNV